MAFLKLSSAVRFSSVFQVGFSGSTRTEITAAVAGGGQGASGGPEPQKFPNNKKCAFLTTTQSRFASVVLAGALKFSVVPETMHKVRHGSEMRLGSGEPQKRAVVS